MSKYFLPALLLAILSIVSFGQEKTLLQKAHDLHQQSKYAEAVEIYKKTIEQKPDNQTLQSAYYGLGQAYKNLKQYDDSVAAFKKALELTNDAADGFSGSGAKGRVQYEIAKILFEKRDYSAALTAFRKAEIYGFPGIDCTMSLKYDLARFEAICLEQLGRYREAAVIYFQLDDARLVELYDAAGQYNDLKTIISKHDEALIAERMQKYSWQRWKATENLPTRRLNEYLKIYELEKNGNIEALVELAHKYSKGSNGEGKIVVNLLARHPNETLPLIKTALDKNAAPFRLFYETLRFIGTDEAIALLKERVMKAGTASDAYFLIYALSQFGTRGEAIINELQQKTSLAENIKYALKAFERERSARNFDKNIHFPPVSAGIKMPTDL